MDTPSISPGKRIILMIRQIHRTGRNAAEKLLHRLKRQRKKSQDNVIGEEKKKHQMIWTSESC